MSDPDARSIDERNPERGDTTRHNADRTDVNSGTERMSDEDFGDGTLPIEAVSHIDTGLRRQDATALDEHPTSTLERIVGIREQTRAGMLGGDRDEIVDLLVQRFGDAGIELGDDEILAMAESIADDRSQLPEGTYEAYREQVDPE